MTRRTSSILSRDTWAVPIRVISLPARLRCTRLSFMGRQYSTMFCRSRDTGRQPVRETSGYEEFLPPKGVSIFRKSFNNSFRGLGWKSFDRMNIRENPCHSRLNKRGRRLHRLRGFLPRRRTKANYGSPEHEGGESSVQGTTDEYPRKSVSFTVKQEGPQITPIAGIFATKAHQGELRFARTRRICTTYSVLYTIGYRIYVTYFIF
jgi:hypothetical protein